jgi:hypothetical protein
MCCSLGGGRPESPDLFRAPRSPGGRLGGGGATTRFVPSRSTVFRSSSSSRSVTTTATGSSQRTPTPPPGHSSTVSARCSPRRGADQMRRHGSPGMRGGCVQAVFVWPCLMLYVMTFSPRALACGVLSCAAAGRAATSATTSRTHQGLTVEPLRSCPPPQIRNQGTMISDQHQPGMTRA